MYKWCFTQNANIIKKIKNSIKNSLFESKLMKIVDKFSPLVSITTSLTVLGNCNPSNHLYS